LRVAPVLVCLLPVLLCGCQPQPADRGAAPQPTVADAAAWPGFDYAHADAPGLRSYRLDPTGSQLDIVVRRDGPLARFGHDHAVSARGLEGFLLLDDTGAGSRADLRFPLEDLDIDSPGLRARYRLDTEPDAKAIQGTRANLMEHVLDARRWPWVTLRLDEFASRQGHYSARLELAINGGQYSSRQPFRLTETDSAMVVEGSVVIRQTELGLEPFTALGGGLRVADPLEIHFRLTGARLAGQVSPTGQNQGVSLPFPGARPIPSEQILDGGPLLPQFRVGGVHPLAAERVDIEILHDPVVAILTNARE